MFNPARRLTPARSAGIRTFLSLITVFALPACADDQSAPTAPRLPAVPAASIGLGTGAFVSRAAPGKCIAVQGALADGIATELQSCDGSAGQQFVALDNGEIRIGSWFCLNAFGGQGNDGDPIGIWICHGGVNQRWTLTAAGEIRGINDKCVDLFAARSDDGTPISLYDCHGGDNQQWDNEGGGVTRAAPVSVASVTVVFDAATLVVGRTSQGTATPLDASGNALAGRTTAWSSFNSDVAIVSTDGLVTAVAVGSTTIAATIEGQTASFAITVADTSRASPPDTIPATPPDTTPAGPPVTGVVVLPGQSIQAAVDANPVGTAFVLKAGTHVRQTVTPKDGNTFTGEPGTVMDGQNATTFAFRGWNNKRWVNDVTIRGLVITRYASPGQNGAIWGGDDRTTSTSGWVLDQLEISYNRNLGVRIGNGMRLTRSNIHHNGTINVGGVGAAVLVEGNEIAFANSGCTNDPGFESGGTKFVKTDALVVRGNYVHDNCGPGLWTDINNINTLYEGNRVERNAREGIVHEVSYRAIIRDNTVTGNGIGDSWRAQGWLWNAGIGIHASPDVEVVGNTVSGNANGIVAVQQRRGAGTTDLPEEFGEYVVRNLYVHDNVIAQHTAPPAGALNVASGAAQDDGTGLIFAAARNNRWANNTYVLRPSGPGFAWMNGLRTDAEWRAFGLDATGTFAR